MIKTATERFIITTKRKTSAGVQEKVQLWDSKKNHFSMPFSTFLRVNEGMVQFVDTHTDTLLATVPMQELRDSSDVTSFNLHADHEVTVKLATLMPAAFEDKNQSSVASIVSSAASLYLYSGSGLTLHSFEQVNAKFHHPSFTLQYKNGIMHLGPGKAELQLKKKRVDGTTVTVRLDRLMQIPVQELSQLELLGEHSWWKFAYFSAPGIMDESEFELVDAQEAKQDFIFKSFFGMGLFVASLALGTYAVLAPSLQELAASKKVLTTADIKIDPALLQAKALHLESLEEEVRAPKPKSIEPNPVASNTAVMSDVNSPATPAQQVAAVPAAAAAPDPIKAQAPAPVAPPVEVAKNEPAATKQSSLNSVPTNSAPRFARTQSRPVVSQPSAEAQLLNRHSKMLQDAFGTVLAMKKPGASASAVTTAVALANAPVSAAGMFKNSGSQDSAVALAGVNHAGEMMQRNSAGNPSALFKTQSTQTIQNGNTQYAANNSKIHVSGQGLGISQSTPEMQQTTSGIRQGDVVAVFKEHMSEIRNCYETALVNHPETRGTVSLAFSIEATGRVSHAMIRDTDIKTADREVASESDRSLPGCLLKRLASWNFPKPKDGKAVDVMSYPLVFKSVGGE
jgi:hypothetical protein